MTFLLDTQILLWSVFQANRLSDTAQRLLLTEANGFAFSTISLLEVAIKATKHPRTFTADARVLQTALLSLGYQELALTGDHSIAVSQLPLWHRDPFDRVPIAQAFVEKMPLVTADRTLARYGDAVLFVG